MNTKAQRAAEIAQLGEGPIWCIEETLAKKLYVYTEGCVLAGRLGRLLGAYHWAEVESHIYFCEYIVRIDSEFGSAETQCIWHTQFEFTDGRKVRWKVYDPMVRTLAQDFYRYGIREDAAPSKFIPTHRHICEKIAQVKLPIVLRAIEAGKEWTFGKYMAASKGVYDAAANSSPGIRLPG